MIWLFLLLLKASKFQFISSCLLKWSFDTPSLGIYAFVFLFLMVFAGLVFSFKSKRYTWANGVDAFRCGIHWRLSSCQRLLSVVEEKVWKERKSRRIGDRTLKRTEVSQVDVCSLAKLLCINLFYS